MNTMETICSRKTIRSYTGENITADELNVILKAANASPVGMGQYDSMHLTVITNEELMNKIDAAGAALFGQPDMHPLYLGCDCSFVWFSRAFKRAESSRRFYSLLCNRTRKNRL